MKKDIEWLVQTINTERESLRQRFESGRETADESAFNDGRDWALLFVLRLIDNLDGQGRGNQMSKLSKETKIELLELSKKITNSISFADVEDIEVSLSDYSNDEDTRSRLNIDIMFKENE